jgi:hypothetical protein
MVAHVIDAGGRLTLGSQQGRPGSRHRALLIVQLVSLLGEGDYARLRWESRSPREAMSSVREVVQAQAGRRRGLGDPGCNHRVGVPA